MELTKRKWKEEKWGLQQIDREEGSTLKEGKQEKKLKETTTSTIIFIGHIYLSYLEIQC